MNEQTQEIPAVEPPTPIKSPMDVYQMVSEIQRRLAVIGIAKAQENEQQGYKFRGIDDVYNAVAPMLPEVGLVIIPKIKESTLNTRTGKGSSTIVHITLTMIYRFRSLHDGSEFETEMPGEAMDYSDKATNKAMSAAQKYLYFQTFTIPVEGMGNDAETASPELGKQTSTGRAPESVAKTAARESGAPMTDVLQNSVSTIQMTVFNDDAPGFYESWDELTNDEKATVYGALDQDTRKQIKTWQNDRKSQE